MQPAGEEPKSAQYKEHKVQHCQQRYSWDCGVSCVLMLLTPEQREKTLDVFHQLCEEEGFRQSTWTIDLAYLLKRFDIEHCMYTTLMGVNEDYRRHGYYNKIIDLDRSRVQRRFASAAADGVCVKLARLPMTAILAHVTSRGPAILLIDAGLLVCRLCKHNKLRAEFRRLFGGGYLGHYILLVGVSGTSAVYRDPACRARLCAAPLAALQRARGAPGTDEDLILVCRDYR